MKQPILAICYDFDKTLSPDDMQAQGYIQSIDYEIAEFWKQSNQLAWIKQGFGSLWTVMDESEKADIEVNNLSDILNYL